MRKFENDESRVVRTILPRPASLSTTLKEPFAVRHQEFLVYGYVKETFAQKKSSVTFSDPNSKKNTGGPFWNPLVPLKTTQ